MMQVEYHFQLRQRLICYWAPLKEFIGLNLLWASSSQIPLRLRIVLFAASRS